MNPPVTVRREAAQTQEHQAGRFVRFTEAAQNQTMPGSQCPAASGIVGGRHHAAALKSPRAGRVNLRTNVRSYQVSRKGRSSTLNDHAERS
jgi:hypothetical protein